MIKLLKLTATLLILAAIFAWSFGVRKMANSGFFQHIDTLTVLVIPGLLFLLVVMIYGVNYPLTQSDEWASQPIRTG